VQQKKTVLQFMAMLLTVSAVLAGQSDAMYFTNVNMTFHDRLGIYDLGNGHSQEENKELMPALGIDAGKNFALPFHLRLAVSAMFEFGSADEYTRDSIVLSTGDIVDAVVSSFMYSVGVSPELQFVFPTPDKLDFFAGVGAGCHYVNL